MAWPGRNVSGEPVGTESLLCLKRAEAEVCSGWRFKAHVDQCLPASFPTDILTGCSNRCMLVSSSTLPSEALLENVLGMEGSIVISLDRRKPFPPRVVYSFGILHMTLGFNGCGDVIDFSLLCNLFHTVIWPFIQMNTYTVEQRENVVWSGFHCFPAVSW